MTDAGTGDEASSRVSSDDEAAIDEASSDESTRERVRLSSETNFALSAPTEIEAVHLEDLSFVLDVEVEDGEVTDCVLDLDGLVHAMTIYSSLEQHRHGWRR